MTLTSFQQEAVKYDKGPLLIIAGAGTGKTTTLVEKIKFLILEKNVKPENILALTFTDKAAREIEERVDEALPYGYFQMYISTFHSFCDQILREEGHEIGLSPNFKLNTVAEQVFFLTKNLFAFNLEYYRPLGNPHKFVEAILGHFSRLRDEDISPEDYVTWAKSMKINSEEERKEKQKYLELSHTYKAFQNIKANQGIMDFADLIYYTVKLFRKRANIVRKYQERFPYILVDEFQDTNIAQYELIKLLAPPNKNPHLTTIGDDNQSIYKFRGAAVSNIIQFINEYKNAKTVVLIENFRSSQKILDSAYKLIKNNDPDTLEARLKISKKLKSVSGPGPADTIEFHLTDRVEDEADFVAKKIRSLKRGHSWRDFAILVRANNHAEPFAKALGNSGIPYQFLGPGTLYKQSEIKDLIAYLRFLNDVGDSASLYRVLTMDHLHIDPKDLAKIISLTKRTSLSMFDAIELYLSFFYSQVIREDKETYRDYLFTTKTKTRESLFNFYVIIDDAIKKLRKETGGQLLYEFIDKSGYLKNLMIHSSEREERIAQNIAIFFDRLRSFETREEDASVSSLVNFLTMSMELGESPLAQEIDWSNFDAVNILTVHSSKGLEFPIVFLVNLTSDRFPSRYRKEIIPVPEALIKEVLPEGDYHLEEERRLFYVGLTRSKSKIVLTTSKFYGERKRVQKISPFVSESIGKEELEENLLANKEQQMPMFDLSSIVDRYNIKRTEESYHFLPPTYFSFSQINTYLTCPLRYKYQYVLRIPTESSSAASFGTSIHSSLQQFFLRVKAGEQLNLNDLLEFYNNSWVPLGYKSKLHEERMKIEGKKYLTIFFEKFFTDSHVLDIERFFKIKVTDDISLGGKIDRVDKKGDKIEIIDYKTGKKPSEKELGRDFQLSIYALAASDKGLYHKSVEKIILTYYFLQDSEKVTFTKTEKDLDEARKKLLEITGAIRNFRYEPKVGPWCSYCPFKINCEAWQ